MKDKLIELVTKGIERDFSKPLKARAGATFNDMRILISYFMDRSTQKLVDLRMAVLLLVLFHGCARFEEAAAIELKNVHLLTSGNVRIDLFKGKVNQNAKQQVLMLEKGQTGSSTYQNAAIMVEILKKKLELSFPSNKFLFPSLKVKKVGKERKIELEGKEMSYNTARDFLNKAVKEIENQEDVSGRCNKLSMHSFRIGALTEAANSGRFTQLQLLKLGRWAKMESAARYFLPKEKNMLEIAGVLQQGVDKAAHLAGTGLAQKTSLSNQMGSQLKTTIKLRKANLKLLSKLDKKKNSNTKNSEKERLIKKFIKVGNGYEVVK